MSIPADKSAGDELSAAEVNVLRDLGFIVDQNAGETINGGTLPVAVYWDNTDDEWKACDGNDATKVLFAGFAISNSTDGNPINVQFVGRVSGFSGLTVGANYYVQDDKTIGTAVGTISIFVGVAISATEILIKGNGAFVDLFGAQTIAGIKTYSSIPILPGSNPTSDNQATRKLFVDKHNRIGVVSADVTVASTTNETTLIQISIPADTLGIDGMIMATLFISDFGSLTPGSGNTDCTIRLKYGGTTIATAVFRNNFSAGNTIANFMGKIEAVIIATGATNTQEGTILGSLGTSAIDTSNPNSAAFFELATGTAAEDSTGALNLTITVQWTVASASNTITMATAIVINA